MPVNTDDYTLAIVCAMAHELDPVLHLFEHPTKPYNRPGDVNVYNLGVLVGHNTVVVAPGKGELTEGLCAQLLRACFTKIELTFLVGICAAMPSSPESKQDIYLGDVIVGTRVWRSLSNSQISDLGPTEGVDFQIRNMQAENASEKVKQIGILLGTKTFRKSISSASATLLQHYQAKDNDYVYPGYSADQKADPTCVHRHRDVNLECSCTFQGQDSCAAAKNTSCAELGCEIMRTRTGIDGELPQPTIHVGTMASSDMVMRAGPKFEDIYRKNNVIGIDMEGGGVSHVTDCIVVKGAVDYADSHKNKRFKDYAAATAAIATKGILQSFFIGQVGEASSLSLFPFQSNPDFVGREDLLDKLETSLFSQCSTSKMAVYGLGGIGKTQLVIQLAHRAQAKYKCLVIWISSANMETLQQGYQDVAERLGLSNAKIKDVGVKKVVQNHLSTYKESRWLLVFDNADDVAMWVGSPDNERLLSYLPVNNLGSIVFTTRNKKTADALAQRHIVEVTEMDFKTTTLMLQKRLQHPELVDAEPKAGKDLLDLLANLPLAIVQAASYINKNSITLTIYVALCHDQDSEIIELLNEDFEEDEKYSDRKSPIATTWLISFNQILHCDPLAAEYLSFTACIAPLHIPVSLLPPGQSRKKEVDALGTLDAYSFIHRQVEGKTFSLHRLVHLVMRSWLCSKGQLNSRNNEVMARLCTALPWPTAINQDQWRSYLPHVTYVLDHGPNSDNGDLRTKLMNLCATSLYLHGQWNDAKTKYQEATQGVFSIEKLTAMVLLARVLGEQRKRQEQCEVLLHAFQESMHMLEVENLDSVSIGWPKTLNVLWSLAEDLLTQHFQRECIQVYSRVIDMSCDKLGREDETTLYRTAFLASVCLDPEYIGWDISLIDENLVRNAKARFDLSLRVFQEKCQQGYVPKVGHTLEIARMMGHFGRRDEERSLILTVLDRTQTTLSAQHPDTQRLRIASGMV